MLYQNPLFSQPMSPFQQGAYGGGYGSGGYGMQQQQQPVHGFVRVHGVEGAYAYYLPNGSEMPLFDHDESKNVMYIKKVDMSGRATVEVIDCFPHKDQPPAEYVTRDELDATYHDLAAQVERMKEAINGLVPATAAASAPAAATSYATTAYAGFPGTANASVPSDDGRQPQGYAPAAHV